MTQPHLTIPARLREILHYDPETGQWTWLVGDRDWRNRFGTLGGYNVIYIDGDLYQASRLTWLYMTGEWPKAEVDHINRNRSDDRFCNLREATHSENMRNKAPRPAKVAIPVKAAVPAKAPCPVIPAREILPAKPAKAIIQAAKPVSRKTLITDRMLRGLKPASAGKRTVIWDTAVPGLCVRVTDKGAASFSVMRRVKGEAAPIRRMLGISWAVPFPAGQPLPYPLATAREDARAMVLDMAHGIDPKQKQAAKRAAEARNRANSFASVAEEFIAKHVRKLRSGRDVEAAIRRELIAKWGERPITEISRRDVVELVEAIASSGRPYAAHRTFAYASKLFTWAMARELYGIETSPCTGIRTSELAGKKEPRQRILADAEICALWQGVSGLGYPAAAFVRLLLLTGQRLREVAGMTWNEVDLDAALWTIPPERMKGFAAHEVPLSTAAVEILKGLPRWPGPFVFSSTGGIRPISGFSTLKEKIDSISPGLAAWRFHDLRRTMRTGLGGLPVPNNVAELCIAHAQPGLHRVYDQHSYRSEKRRAFELWAARVMSIVEPVAESNVIQIAARG